MGEPRFYCLKILGIEEKVVSLHPKSTYCNSVNPYNIKMNEKKNYFKTIMALLTDRRLLFICLSSFLCINGICANADRMGQAQWIMSATCPSMSCERPVEGVSMPIFRKTFSLGKLKGKVILRATALGIYTIEINGKPVDGHELKPGWTDYRHEVTFQTIDITSYLYKGTNEIRAQLSHGWWSGKISRGVYGKDVPLAFMAEIEADGKLVASTDASWQCSHDGSLLLGDIYNGEIYDARQGANQWSPVAVWNGTAPKVVPFEGPEVRIRPENMWRLPQTITIYSDTIPTGTTYGMIKTDTILNKPPFTLRRGETAVIDLGQNMVGWISLKAKAAKGTVLTIHHGEMLNYNGDKTNRLDDGPGGSVWTYNLRGARATVEYTFAGNKDGESYHPHHTFMGFRYASITATDDVTIHDIVGQVVGSDITEWGQFECSDASINQLFSNIIWGQRGNFLSVPTDCPQRNERLGWTGDTQIFARTALYNSDAADFYRKWMRDMRNSQDADGAYPDVAPFPNFWGYGTGAWGDAGVIVPWTVYHMTGDKTILKENYESMTKWMQWLSRQSETVAVEGSDADSITYTHIGGLPKTGDWLAYEPLERRYVCTAYYAYVAQLMDSISSALSLPQEAKHYRDLYGDIRSEFQQRYVRPDGTLRKPTQTAYLLALRLGLLEPEHRQAARDSLRAKIENNGYRLSTGFVGTGILCTTLSDEGMDDLAYALLLQRGNPSWLYSIDQGATTVWERWDSYTRENGFHKHHWNMNSFNHYAYGAIAEWMYAYICGIQPAAPGFSRVTLSPHVDRRPANHPSLAFQPRITWARGKTHTPYGDIESEWRHLPNGHYEYQFIVPRGVAYDIYIKDLSDEDIVKVKTR